MSQASAEALEVAGRSACPRILVIEDEPNSREGLCALLAEEGFLVRAAEDGEDGLEQIVEFKPDVVLCDLMLPRLDGLSLWGKARELGSDAGFIMMTGAAKSIDVPCIAKPVDLTTVLEAVGRLLKQRLATNA